MEHYKFFQNKNCAFFPCHRGVAEEKFNCLFCFCPLYSLGDRCGGQFCYTESGIKDCSNCVRPHLRDNYENILAELVQVMEQAKKKPYSEEKT